MSVDPSRRDLLAERATDYALEHGLIGLSLRPLAADIGTSDRMLLYHFADKDDLVATILRISNDRSVACLEAVPPGDDLADGVRRLWHALRRGRLEQCQRLYVEAAALGLLGQEPYASVVKEANDRWMAALARHLEASGCPPGVSVRTANLVESVMVGLLLDQPLTATSVQAQVVEDLVAALPAAG